MLRIATLFVGLGLIGVSALAVYEKFDYFEDFAPFLLLGAAGVIVALYCLRSRPLEGDDLLSIWIDFKKADLRARLRDLD